MYVSVVAPPPQSTFLDEAVTVEVSNDGGFKESRTFVLDDGKATLPWRLRSGRDQTFTKVVYVRFNNESGTVVLTLSDDIILDSSKPILAGVSVVSSRSSPRPIEVLSFSGARGRRGVSLVVRGSDTISGVASLEIRSSAKRHSTTLQFSPSNGPPSSRVKMMTKRVPVTTKATRLQVRLIDRAGNHSAWKAVVLR